jgi:hypothetical protein
MRALAALPKLSMLNLYTMPWAEDAVKLGLGRLVARMPQLRVLNASHDVLVRPCMLHPSKMCPAACSAETNRAVHCGKRVSF